MASTESEIVHAYFAAMRQGSSAASELFDLFASDAVYIEPFSGNKDPAIGIEAIAERFRQGWEHPLNDMELEVLSVVVDGRRAQSRWECRSPDLARPTRGIDEYEIRDGQITRLEVRLED